MKQILYLLLSVVILTSCSVMIPVQTNLNDQVMLSAENRNIKANYVLESDVSDGFIPYVSVQKNGYETINKNTYKYASETAFKKLWESFFKNKFNPYANDQMDIEVTLKELILREQASTSVGMTLLTGNTKVNVDG